MEKTMRISDVMEAKRRTRPYVRETPLFRAYALETLFRGAEIYLKMENFQYTGSFKVRGVANKMLRLTQDELRKGVTAASSGNHAQAVAFVAQSLGTKAVIVMPENAPQTKIQGAQGYGAEIVLCGLTGEDRDLKCAELVERHGYSLVHSHMDPLVIAGHGSVAAEAYEQSAGDFDEIVLPCGAGSLAAGAAFAVKGLAPWIRVTAVEPGAVPRFTESLRVRKPVTVALGSTIADGLRVGKAEKINYEMIRDYVDVLLCVDEAPIKQACYEILTKAKILAEPSACVGVAAALTGQIDTGPGRKILFVVTGGNTDPAVLSEILILNKGGARDSQSSQSIPRQTL
jgi:threonine dehydratase